MRIKKKISKDIALKVESMEEQEEYALEEDEKSMLLMKRLGKFFWK